MTKISQKRREKSATVHSGGKAKYPVDSPKTAESAAQLINSAKPPLTDSQRSNVAQEIHAYLPGKKIPPKKGSRKNKK